MNHERRDERNEGAVADRPPSVVRRDFLRLVGAAAIVGAPGCSRAPRGKLRPYVVQPPGVVPGNPLFFATSILEAGYASGLVVESHEGRPTKIEGNARHPASLGATSAAQQAALLDLYDPDRARGITRLGAPATWRGALDALRRRARESRVHVLLEATSSPLVAAQVAALRALSPEVDVRWFAPLAPLAEWAGSKLAFGRVLDTRFDLSNVRVLVALDADLLCAGPAAVCLARQFADTRRIAAPSDEMSRFYAVEPCPSVTGMSADHRLRVPARDVLSVAAGLALGLERAGLGLPAELGGALAPWAARVAAHTPWIEAVARDLVANRGRSLVVAGPGQPPSVHALVHGLNAVLGGPGQAVTYGESPIADAGTDAFDLLPLLRDLDAGDVEMLIVAAPNPVYSATADLALDRRFARAKESIYLGSYADETARVCTWHAARAHFLETWADGRAFDGTVSFVQPLATPRFDTYTTPALLGALGGEALVTDHHRLLAFWQRARPDAAAWDRWLERGLIEGSATPPATPPPVHFSAVRDAIAQTPLPDAAPSLELVFRRDARLGDGEHSNNAWLMELPDPVTRQSWGNAALLSPTTAARLDVRDGDVLDLRLGGRRTTAPALVVEGQADDVIALALGHGRAGAGEEIARGVGTNANLLRTTDAPWFAAGLVVARTGAREDVALAQTHSSLEGRDDDVLLHRTRDEFRRQPGFAKEGRARHLALYDLAPSGPRQWGMVIDLNACTGCAACVVACQAENNVPAVGKAGVAKGRAMHWLRVDRYVVGREDPRALVQPMACQHCERAPCEYVCPVNATTHSSDGLNQMIYNRCVGTRFCSNNCPYKVRRFNWFNYHQDEDPELAGIYNPDVTVRARGVMEKCTYCVQRIREAEIHAEIERRPLADGDVVTACEEACPSRAITFGDTNDRSSRVSRLRDNPRAFAVLGALGTRPRTLYLARITNPNPEIT
jgi:molybdopterin-containing oxidoreductase family iron-sulfur binding subunit